MFRQLLKSKIHRARITEANVDYEGSITISPSMLALANILPNEVVSVWNVTRGTRFDTYTIAGYEGSQDICVNGAAAHLVQVNDLIIIASFTFILEEVCRDYTPTIIFVDEHNQPKEIRAEEAFRAVS